MESISELTKQLANLLRNELKDGKVTVTCNVVPKQTILTRMANLIAVLPHCRIDWYINGLNIVTVFDLNVFNNCTDNINEEIIKPTVLKLKMFKRKQEMEVSK